MKKFFAIAFTLMVAFTVTSCKKCSTCIVRDVNGSLVKVLPETCGKQDDVDSYKSTCDIAYGSTGNTCECKGD